MKKAMTLVLVMVLVASFAIGVFAKPGDTTHECWYETVCDDGACQIFKCCQDCVKVKGGWDCTDPICALIS